MTDVVDTVTEQSLDTGQVGRPRQDAAEPRLVDEELADRLLAQAAEQGVELLGEGGLLKQMTKAILERSLPAREDLQEEPTLHAVTAKWTLRSYRAGTLDLDW